MGIYVYQPNRQTAKPLNHGVRVPFYSIFLWGIGGRKTVEIIKSQQPDNALIIRRLSLDRRLSSVPSD